MDKMITAGQLLTYISEATSPFQVVETTRQELLKCGFEELTFTDNWKLKKGKKYITRPYGTSLFAFAIGKSYTEGSAIRFAAAHTDHPCLKIKPMPEMTKDGYLQLDVDVYGGPIISTWLDRPLSVAGTVALRSDKTFEPDMRLVDFKRPLLTIPNLCIHFDREANKGKEFNKQTELLPVLGMVTEELEKDGYFINALAEEIDCQAKDILDFDLYIYNAEEGCLLGLNDDMISAPRLDNLTSCFAGMKAIEAARQSADALNVVLMYDNEEIGSRTKQGADSQIAMLLVEKIYEGLGFDEKNVKNAILRSMFLSMDVAHAYHPNFGAKYDPNNKCLCNKGVVFKLSSTQRYPTDAKAIGAIMQMCDKAKVPYQKFVNRSDVVGGSTLGSIAASYMPIYMVDMGVGILAMHSARELMGVDDENSLVELVTAFFRE